MPAFKDRTGERYGRLVVVEQDGWHVFPGGTRAAKWLCRCDCGSETVVSGGDLGGGKVASCGCVRRGVRSDLSGRVFGRLTVIRFGGWYTAPGSGYRSAIWLCRCVCGNERPVVGANLTGGQTTSCGCYVREANFSSVQVVSGPAALSYSQAKGRAKKAGREFELTLDEYAAVRERPCVYCGFDAGPVSVDRIDSSRGYTLDNVQPLCRVCNNIKSQFAEEFLRQHIIRIVRHQGLVKLEREGDEEVPSAS